MEYTSTTRRAVMPQRSDSPGSNTSRSARQTHRDRTAPPHWYTAHPTIRPGDARAAERLLRSNTPAPATYPALLHAARVLLHNGAPQQTATWCAELHPQARTASWAAAFRTLRAEALLQLGDLTTAGEEAAAAQDAIGTRPTSLRLWPTAVRAEVLIAQGRYEEASAHLDQPAPDNGWAGVPVLRARGRLHLAAHRHQDALDTFVATARLARRHGTGRLPHLPWRGDIAETLLCSGRVGQARALLTEELAVPAIGPRHRASALRLLAVTDAPGPRLRTLARAVGETRRCKDRIELARVMADYAHALDALDDASSAAFLRRATDLAADCGLSPTALTTGRRPAPGQAGHEQPADELLHAGKA
ncbi:hypothetical protein AQI88_40510 [Streptomyces cellostaticus]|uniref:Tetratricopeptide repeat protein n=1 Tax=Streptomyces cellostaticus TaxID=67285 RepID=A0A101N6Y0_9ACTN|nr:hypothetical protein [Streptomyces cellostaticus]KUM87631.1 hypothetical protein AQI88_40510 [Streptomyces cellostaticus]GHI10349.1 hypothetical protein Scel_86700 [Streptomyces cellostaticus]